MKPVSVLILAILALAQGLPALFFPQDTGILPTYKASLGRSRKRLTFLRLCCNTCVLQKHLSK
jgi:hypothetical protein